MPPELENKAAEYLVPKQLRAEFDNELWTWIDNGRMIPYPEEECALQQGPDSVIGSVASKQTKSLSGQGLSGAQ